eukprot:CCRYP_015888-RA/>CCRYP_015888-RA protein AED:0.04 eAED:0.04 QI:54/1/1/1/1/1/2/265/384
MMSSDNSKSSANTLRSLIFTPSTSAHSPPSATLSVLDQLLLPHETKYIPIRCVQDAWSVIRTMQIRGAPLIAIVAVLGLAVDLTSYPSTIRQLEGLGVDEIKRVIVEKMEYLKTSRPTAVNVFNAMEELSTTILADSSLTTREELLSALMTHASYMLERDVSDNRSIGSHGADEILAKVDERTNVRVITICNTGSLATAGWGTALGVARELCSRGRMEGIACLETRPYNQGSRLTAYEILTEKMPNPCLLCDSMISSYLATKGSSNTVCIVGADRVCANGDTANKIGTFQLAIVAKEFGVDFYVASPFTTLDVKLKSGKEIEIEERPPGELLESSGAPKDMKCWNPGFDVTPAAYITGIITEKGVVRRSEDGTLDVEGFVEKMS